MEPAWFSLIDGWRDFYVLIGTAAATLMGLVFVVVSLGKGTLKTERGRRAARAFYTPVVAFFTTEIAVAMLMLIPKSTPAVLASLLGLTGAAGLAYMFATGALQVGRESELQLDDLLCYVALPFVSYIALIGAAAGVWRASSSGLYATAAVMILLLLVGIRNAWDLVVYIAQRDDAETD